MSPQEKKRQEKKRQQKKPQEIKLQEPVLADGQVGSHPAQEGSFPAQVASLQRAADLAVPFLDEDVAEEAAALVERANIRGRLSAEHTTVGFFGATGSGKSTLFNRVVGEEVASTGVVRPTTFRTTAAVWQNDGAQPLLDWLEVDEVWVAPEGQESPLILLDLPDFDSVAAENRQVVDRLAGQVDVLVWVVDPQKYADRVLHTEYVRPLSHQAATTLVVLNQVDRLDAGELDGVLVSLQRLLSEDGLGQAPIFLTSATVGTGVAELAAQLHELAAQRSAAQARVSADISHWATRMVETYSWEPSTDEARALPNLYAGLEEAVGTQQLADAAGASYRKRSAGATGWLLTSWLGKLRADPLRRLGVESSPTLSRSSRGGSSGVGRAVLGTTVREYARSVAAPMPLQWRPLVQGEAAQITQTLSEKLERAVGLVDFRVGPSWWWPVAKLLQWLFLGVAMIGFGWYLVAWLAAVLVLPVITVSHFEGWPVPGLLIGFGLLGGLLVGGLFSVFGRATGRRRTRAARKVLGEQVAAVADSEVVQPLSALVGRGRDLSAALESAQRLDAP